MVERVLRRVDWLNTRAAVVADVLICAMAVHIFADITLRKFANRPLEGTTEIVTNYYMVAIAFLPLALIQRTKGHIAADLFFRGIGPRLSAFLDASAALCMAAYAALIVWWTALEAWHLTGLREAVELANLFIYIWPVRWFVPIGFGAMALVATLQAIQDFGHAFGRQPR